MGLIKCLTTIKLCIAADLPSMDSLARAHIPALFFRDLMLPPTTVHSAGHPMIAEAPCTAARIAIILFTVFALRCTMRIIAPRVPTSITKNCFLRCSTRA